MKNQNRRSKKEKKVFRWKMPTMCATCPFADSGKGLHMRESLQPGRFAQIVRSILKGASFWCHETTHATGKNKNLYCAGALAYQEARGVDAPYVQLCRRFEGVHESKRTIFKRLRAIGRKEKR